MRWFKHLSASSHDDKLSILLDEFGPMGYGVWWLILEMIASSIEGNRQPSCRYSLRFWANSCKISQKNFKKVAEFLGKIKLLVVEFENNSTNNITISCPNIFKYRDEYTKKKNRVSGVNPESVRSKSGECPDQHTHTELQNTDIQNTDIYTIENNSFPTPLKLQTDEPTKKKRGRPLKNKIVTIEKEEKNDYIDELINIFKRKSIYLKGFPPTLYKYGKAREQAGSIAAFFKDLNLSTEDTINLYRRMLVCYFYEKDPTGNGVDFDYNFGFFVSTLSRWMRYCVNVIEIEEPQDILKLTFDRNKPPEMRNDWQIKLLKEKHPEDDDLIKRFYRAAVEGKGKELLDAITTEEHTERKESSGNIAESSEDAALQS